LDQDGSHIAFASSADVVVGGNTDLNIEAYLARCSLGPVAAIPAMNRIGVWLIIMILVISGGLLLQKPGMRGRK